MIYYFTSNKLVGSRLIKWGLDDDCSHFAVGFWNHDYALIVESTMGSGFRLSWLSDFKKRNKIVHALRYEVDNAFDGDHYKKICGHLHGSKYDYKGVLWWFVIGLLYKLKIITKEKLDTIKNQWADRNSVYCVEVLKAQKEFLESKGFDMSGLNIQNLRPHKAYELLLKTEAFEDISHGPL